MSGHPLNFDPRPAGVWAEPYLMPDGSRPVTAIDTNGVLRGVFFMRPGDDPSAVRLYMERLLRAESLHLLK